jgi:chromosomal replication initiation ATPase DnaA
MKEQFALDLPARVDFRASRFIDGAANADARAALLRWRDWPRGVMALIGPEGSGKSHLASIWTEDARARTLSFRELAGGLEGLPAGTSLLVEDIDQDVPEQALFHAINRAAEQNVPALLLTARQRPVLWKVELPDLVSRLRALPHVELHEPDDELLTRVLEKLFSDRGSPVNPGVIEYLLPRMDRSVAAARQLVEQIDKRALVKKTPVTRSVAREVLERWGEEGSD